VRCSLAKQKCLQKPFELPEFNAKLSQCGGKTVPYFEPASEKLLSPSCSRDMGALASAERRQRRPESAMSWQSSARYDGVSPRSNLKTIMASLKTTRCFNGSQCKLIKLLKWVTPITQNRYYFTCWVFIHIFVLLNLVFKFVPRYPAGRSYSSSMHFRPIFLVFFKPCASDANLVGVGVLLLVVPNYLLACIMNAAIWTCR